MAMKLYEITALVTVSTVILAETEAAALNHVKTWETAWLNQKNADFIAVSDIEVGDIRKPESDDWRDDAHDKVERNNR